ITKRSYVCDGYDGFDGFDGAPALVKTTRNNYYSFCGGPGVKVESGTDYNLNKNLDTSEIQNTNYVCDGFDGVDGLDGLDGFDGADGIVEVTGGYYSDCGGGWGILVEGGT